MGSKRKTSRGPDGGGALKALYKQGGRQEEDFFLKAVAPESGFFSLLFFLKGVAPESGFHRNTKIARGMSPDLHWVKPRWRRKVVGLSVAKGKADRGEKGTTTQGHGRVRKSGLGGRAWGQEVRVWGLEGVGTVPLLGPPPPARVRREWPGSFPGRFWRSCGTYSRVRPPSGKKKKRRGNDPTAEQPACAQSL